MSFLLSTERFGLRPLRIEDATAEYLRWLSDAAFVAVSAGDQDLDDLREFIRRRQDRTDVLFLAIVDLATGRHIGNIKYEPVDEAQGYATMGILIGDADFQGRGVAAEVLRGSAHWLQANRRISTIVLGVDRQHSRAIRAYEKVGFVAGSTPHLRCTSPDQMSMVWRLS
jgi:ribosomal-protein-alanine N-acetyltransferase